jgi:hypothetical protein
MLKSRRLASIMCFLASFAFFGVHLYDVHSESSDERESAPAPTFKPAWQNDSEDDDSDHEGSSKEKTAVAKEDNDAAATAVSTGVVIVSDGRDVCIRSSS